VAVYGCENLPLTLREEHRLRVVENRVLRRIFGLKRDEVTGGWRKLHYEEIRNLYSSPNKIRMIMSRRRRWAGHVARRREEECMQDTGGKTEGKRPQGKPRRRWVENRILEIQDGVVWTGSIWLRIRTSGGLF
jgi:hypothetical protein